MIGVAVRGSRVQRFLHDQDVPIRRSPQATNPLRPSGVSNPVQAPERTRRLLPVRPPLKVRSCAREPRHLLRQAIPIDRSLRATDPLRPSGSRATGPAPERTSTYRSPRPHESRAFRGNSVQRFLHRQDVSKRQCPPNQKTAAPVRALAPRTRPGTNPQGAPALRPHGLRGSAWQRCPAILTSLGGPNPPLPPSQQTRRNEPAGRTSPLAARKPPPPLPTGRRGYAWQQIQPSRSTPPLGIRSPGPYL